MGRTSANFMSIFWGKIVFKELSSDAKSIAKYLMLGSFDVKHTEHAMVLPSIIGEMCHGLGFSAAVYFTIHSSFHYGRATWCIVGVT